MRAPAFDYITSLCRVTGQLNEKESVPSAIHVKGWPPKRATSHSYNTSRLCKLGDVNVTYEDGAKA